MISSQARGDNHTNKAKGHIMHVTSELPILLQHLNHTCDLSRGLMGFKWQDIIFSHRFCEELLNTMVTCVCYILKKLRALL